MVPGSPSKVTSVVTVALKTVPRGVLRVIGVCSRNTIFLRPAPADFKALPSTSSNPRGGGGGAAFLGGAIVTLVLSVSES